MSDPEPDPDRDDSESESRILPTAIGVSLCFRQNCLFDKLGWRMIGFAILFGLLLSRAWGFSDK